MEVCEAEYRLGPVVCVEYSMDGGFHGRWNVNLGACRDRWFDQLPERALDDAVFSANELKDFRQIERLMSMRDERRHLIQEHFRICADKLIAQIEDREGWEEWMPRLWGRAEQNGRK